MRKDSVGSVVLIDWIERCLDEGKGLTIWERNFLESLDEQMSRTGKLSEKQEEVLERIYVGKVP